MATIIDSDFGFDFGFDFGLDDSLEELDDSPEELDDSPEELDDSLKETEFFNEPSNVLTLIEDKVFEIVGYGDSSYLGIGFTSFQNDDVEGTLYELTLHHIFVCCAEDDSKYDIQFYIHEDKCKYVVKEISNYSGMTHYVIGDDTRIRISNRFANENKSLLIEKYGKYYQKYGYYNAGAIPALGFDDFRCDWFFYSPYYSSNIGSFFYYPCTCFGIRMENMEEIDRIKRAV
jgi:hypothetical protein